MSTYSAAPRFICRRSTPYEINPPASAKLSASVHNRQPSRYGALGDLPTSTHLQCIFQREETSCSSLRGFDAGQDLIGAFCFEHLDRLFRRHGCLLQLLQCERRERRIRIRKNCEFVYLGGDRRVVVASHRLLPM
jgi:hypothetical protein